MMFEFFNYKQNIFGYRNRLASVRDSERTNVLYYITFG